MECPKRSVVFCVCIVVLARWLDLVMLDFTTYTLLDPFG